MLTEGIYIVTSNKMNVLVKIIGQGQFLRPIKGILLNDFICKGEVTVLGENSKELQDIACNTDNYDFIEMPLTKSVLNEIGFGSNSFAKVINLEELTNKYIESYKNFLYMYGNSSRFTVELMTKESLTTGQVNTIINNIKRRINSL